MAPQIGYPSKIMPPATPAGITLSITSRIRELFGLQERPFGHQRRYREQRVKLWKDLEDSHRKFTARASSLGAELRWNRLRNDHATQTAKYESPLYPDAPPADPLPERVERPHTPCCGSPCNLEWRPCRDALIYSLAIAETGQEVALILVAAAEHYVDRAGIPLSAPVEEPYFDRAVLGLKHPSTVAREVTPNATLAEAIDIVRNKLRKPQRG